MSKRILIMGLPGSGKTYFAERLKLYLETYGPRLGDTYPDYEGVLSTLNIPAKVDWFNADDVRKRFNDWDFSNEGRLRQSLRMFEFALRCTGDYVICDFVAPLPQMRENFKADWTIWMDTIDMGRYEDTNKIFVKPESYDFRITEQNAEKWVKFVGDHIIQNRRRPVFDWKKETAQMLGRYQPWHAGHRALFEEALKKVGQVCIMIRDCQGWNNSNPFALEQVKEYIKKDLEPLHQGTYEIIMVPNIVEIVYGRDVGYQITKIELPEEIQKISATNVRKEMGLQ